MLSANVTLSRHQRISGNHALLGHVDFGLRARLISGEKITDIEHESMTRCWKAESYPGKFLLPKIDVPILTIVAPSSIARQ